MEEQSSQHPPREKSEIQTFFDQLRSKDNQSEDEVKYRKALQRIEMRQHLMEKHFSDQRSFEQYVNSHPQLPLIQSKIEEVVALHKVELLRLAEEQDNNGLQNQPLLEQYRFLVNVGYVDANNVFSPMPPISSLCELMRLLQYDPDNKSVINEATAAMKYLQNRMYILTGEYFAENNIPPVSRLTQLVAPIPYRSAWSEKHYSSEAERMGHVPPTAPGNSGNGNGSANPSNGNSGSGNGAETNGATVAEGTSTDSSESVNGNGADTNSQCSIEELYRLAGANFLRQPSQQVPDGTRYTFPERDPGRSLRWGEDIFYDHVVMVPLPECGIQKEIVGPELQSLETAKQSAIFARELLAYLIHQNLQNALGQGGLNNLTGALDDVINTRLGVSTRVIRAMKKRLKEKAAFCRSISRMRLLFTPSTNNLFQNAAALSSAIANFPQIVPRSRRVPSEQVNGETIQTLQITDRHAAENQRYIDARDHDGEFSPPDANDDSRQMFEWTWQTSFQNKRLRRYTEYLGRTFYDKLQTLLTEAQKVSSDLAGVTGGTSNALADFERLAAEILNSVLIALAQLFDDIAEQLPLPSIVRGEGFKRLALMVTFRQYWYADGYVAGKLVGYKNLLPNQRDTFKRRTFIKTTRETTSVEEFAASREEDFSRSSKETAEVMRETSSQHNLSASASGGFDFIVVGGDYEVNNTNEWRDLSRGTHNKVAEATMKSSAKYSEKREVKIRELTEIEDVQEVTTEVQNLNREITANYFYYQLYRQYFVETEFHSVKPVLLRTREVPLPATVDEKFLSNYAHILIHALPRQLSADLQETAGEIEMLGRTMVRRHVDMDQKSVTYEVYLKSPIPPTPEGQSQWRAQLETMQRDASDARGAYITAEENYMRAKNRLDRVITHVRENICYYMHFIWHSSPKVDQDRLLQEMDEQFNRQPLAQVTRGLSRIGYFGDEEIFEYTGLSLGALEALVNLYMPGHQFVASKSDEELLETQLFSQLRRFYPYDSDERIIHRIRTRMFIEDPARPEEIDNSRYVQIAQDALIVEAIPGQVPLLEGFQMAHRMLDVQEKCLQNRHLRERINDRPWENNGEDSYRVIRREQPADTITVNVNKEE